jgi:hypothetical protein
MSWLARQIASSAVDYDGLVDIEDRVIGCCGPDEEIDGHDLGQGEANILILTEDPERTVLKHGVGVF